MRRGRRRSGSTARRPAPFYALLLKDAGCSSNAARMCSLFGADDLAVKRRYQARRLDAADGGAALRRTAVAPAATPAAARPRLRCAAVELAADKAHSSRPAASAARGSWRMLEFPPAAADGRALARRALERQGPAGRAEGRRDPAPGAHRVPRADGRGLPPRPRRRRRARDAARAARALVRPRARRRLLGLPDGDRAVARARRGQPAPASRASRRRPDARGATTSGSTASPRPSPRSSTRSRPTRSTTRAAWPTTRPASARSSATARRRCAPAPHGPAARHRQAGRLEPHPRQAGAS